MMTVTLSVDDTVYDDSSSDAIYSEDLSSISYDVWLLMLMTVFTMKCHQMLKTVYDVTDDSDYSVIMSSVNNKCL